MVLFPRTPAHICSRIVSDLLCSLRRVVRRLDEYCSTLDSIASFLPHSGSRLLQKRSIDSSPRHSTLFVENSQMNTFRKQLVYRLRDIPGRTYTMDYLRCWGVWFQVSSRRDIHPPHMQLHSLDSDMSREIMSQWTIVHSVRNQSQSYREWITASCRCLYFGLTQRIDPG